jgi:hypothetical protein
MAFLHASKSGYFPFCLEEATEGQYGPGTSRPFEMSLEDAMAFYWKYRTIKITGSISGTFITTDGDETFTWAWTATGTGNLIDNELPKMSDLVCNSIFTRTFAIEVINEDALPSDPIVISSTSEGQISYLLEAGGSFKKTPPNPQEEIKIYPLVDFNTSFENDTAGPGAFFRLSGNDFIPDPEFQEQTNISDGFQIKINGTIYKTLMYVVYNVPFSVVLISLSGFLLIEGVDERLTE